MSAYPARCRKPPRPPQVSQTAAFKPKTAARAPVAARPVSCSAEAKEARKQLSTGVAAAALALTFGFGAVDAAYADVAGLTPCSESKAFAKRKKQEVRGAGLPTRGPAARCGCNRRRV